MKTLKLDCPRQIGKTTYCKHLLELRNGQVIMMIVPTIVVKEMIVKDSPQLKDRVLNIGSDPRGKHCDVLIFDDCFHGNKKYETIKRDWIKSLRPEFVIEIYTSKKLDGILNKLYR